MDNLNLSYLAALLCIFMSLITAILATKKWRKIAKRTSLLGKDINKESNYQIPESGGIAVIASIILSLFSYVFFKIFLLNSETHLVIIFVIVISLLLGGFIGFTDDILGWKIGFSQWAKPLITLPVAIPLMAINAGTSTMSLPLLGFIELGIIYPLFIIPIGIVGASNGFNMLAGLNGLEAGMGAIILSTLGLVAWLSNNQLLSLVAFISVAALFGFLIFNKYPSKIFPGDSLTYGLGSLIAILAILGDMEKIGLILFTPYFIELIIKTKNKFKTECFGIPKNGKLLPPQKIGSLTHIYMKYFKTEKRTVRALLLSELLIAILVVLIWI